MKSSRCAGWALGRDMITQLHAKDIDIPLRGIQFQRFLFRRFGLSPCGVDGLRTYDVACEVVKSLYLKLNCRKVSEPSTDAGAGAAPCAVVSEDSRLRREGYCFISVYI